MSNGCEPCDMLLTWVDAIVFGRFGLLFRYMSEMFEYLFGCVESGGSALKII
ncbi:hypothetical protein SAMN05216215_10622 [Saccharopolyspora shandongensis]|uniref:Uncharacterized protein n=1 Tax=Saccharopolyspora shandongensis TaxID=418495 RepID=A0A1H3SAQ8_9PSEU|nr:hypothetical protein SAMN05216215_10622 [Saccharopolyspora shandongensis]